MARKKVVALDLETIADKTIIPLLPEIKANSRLKDPKKIKADIAAKKEKQLADMGLNPLHNLICSAAWCDENGPGVLTMTANPKDEHQQEKDLLESLWDVLAKYDLFVTFNGREFDIRCIYLHGITHGIRPPIKIDNGRYNRGNHTDLRQTLSGFSPFAPGKLDFYLQKFLGYGKMKGIDGAMVQSYFDMGLIEDIADYNQDDAQKTYELYLAVERAGLIE